MEADRRARCGQPARPRERAAPRSHAALPRAPVRAGHRGAARRRLPQRRGSRSIAASPQPWRVAIAASSSARGSSLRTRGCSGSGEADADELHRAHPRGAAAVRGSPRRPLAGTSVAARRLRAGRPPLSRGRAGGRRRPGDRPLPAGGLADIDLHRRARRLALLRPYAGPCSGRPLRAAPRSRSRRPNGRGERARLPGWTDRDARAVSTRRAYSSNGRGRPTRSSARCSSRPPTAAQLLPASICSPATSAQPPSGSTTSTTSTSGSTITPTSQPARRSSQMRPIGPAATTSPGSSHGWPSTPPAPTTSAPRWRGARSDRSCSRERERSPRRRECAIPRSVSPNPTDTLNQRAKVQLDAAEVAALSGDDTKAAAFGKRAVELYELKGNVVAAASARTLREEGVPA